MAVELRSPDEVRNAKVTCEGSRKALSWAPQGQVTFKRVHEVGADGGVTGVCAVPASHFPPSHLPPLTFSPLTRPVRRRLSSLSHFPPTKARYPSPSSANELQGLFFFFFFFSSSLRRRRWIAPNERIYEKSARANSPSPMELMQCVILVLAVFRDSQNSGIIDAELSPFWDLQHHIGGVASSPPADSSSYRCYHTYYTS